MQILSNAMKRQPVIPLLAAVLASTTAWADQASSATSELYELVLEHLRKSDAVIPWAPDTHPVRTVANREAIVPPQCYTKTAGSYNPCYVCHQAAISDRENVMNDADLQLAYSFSDLGMTNQWRNLFEDRRERIAATSDEDILNYVAQDNYSELPERLREAGFAGWIPDLKDLSLASGAFDDEGFARDGSHWVAFNYKPFPSTFWPTNGSTDDVMIRLPEAFRSDISGSYSRDIYKANLSILEANMKGLPRIATLAIDEQAVGLDLDQDGNLGIARAIADVSRYVGAAANTSIVTHLYPEGVEFLHTVRYLGLDENDAIAPSTRMKEVRYMKKWKSYSKSFYGRRYQLEAFEKEAGNLPGYINLGQHGLDNGSGWSIQGFIESHNGRLRANTFEENLFCMGCHNSIGSTIDKTFSFARKIDGPQGWGYIDLKGMRDAPSHGETEGEILAYLRRVGGGSEFRHNEEMQQKWFLPDGTLDEQKVRSAADVYELIAPSKERAIALNKAYKTIVEDQDFIYGRDATFAPPPNVYQAIDNDTTPTLPEDKTYRYNILLDWQAEGPQASSPRFAAAP